MLDVGNRVAGFEIEAYVARGGMAVVYRAREVGLGGRVVALKVIAPELASDETFRRRFTQESHLAASIDHPNIIPIYAAGEADGQLYLVMRYVDGETLGAVFKDQGPLGPAEVLAIFAQVAGALDAAHAHELVHRDVKPKNILLVGDAELTRRHVYLSDFGLTKRVSGDTSVTTAGQFLGTIRYVAPGADLQCADQPSRRHLLAGLRDLRGADRRAAVRQQRRGGHALVAHVAGSAGRVAAPARAADRGRRRAAARTRQGSRSNASRPVRRWSPSFGPLCCRHRALPGRCLFPGRHPPSPPGPEPRPWC